MTLKSSARKKEEKKEETPFYTKATATVLAGQAADPVTRDPKQADPDWLALRSHLDSRLVSLRSWRASWWMENWSDLAQFILPRRSIWLTQSSGGIPSPNNMSRGREINKAIVDPTATYAARVCAGGMVTGLAGPSRPWFKIMPAVERSTLDAAGRKWIDETEARLYTVIAATNFYDSFAQECEDVIVFGTAPSIIYEDEIDIFRCYNPCVGEYMLANGGTNRINGLYRQFLDTTEQAVDFFGVDNLPGAVVQQWKQKGSGLQNESIINHSIEPNYGISKSGGAEVGVVPGGFTWREVYWMNNSEKPCSMAGFHEQPFTVSLWSRQSNDAYGRGPGMDVLPDVLQLQVMTRRMAEAIEKQVRPPLVADMSLKNQPSSILPGHVTYVAQLGPGTGMRSIYDVNPEIKEMMMNIQAIEQRIKIGLFNDIFMAVTNLPGDQRTATEINARVAEAMQVLGPVIENMLGVLKQKLKRIYGIMNRKGFIDPLPDSLKGVPLNIDFVSTLAVAQKAASLGGMERIAGLIGNMVAVWPEAKDNLDPDDYIRKTNELLGNPQTIIRSPDQLKQIRDMQKKAAQATAAMNAAHGAAQTASVGADAANTLASTKVGGGNDALSLLLQGGGQATLQ